MRAETGPLQFEDDWPGIFIRGDNALVYANYLAGAITLLRNTETFPYVEKMVALQRLLESCHADTVEEKGDLQHAQLTDVGVIE